MIERTLAVIVAAIGTCAACARPVWANEWVLPIETSGMEPHSFSVTVGESVLLLGERTVANTAGLAQRFFAAQKHPANPVLRRAEPWEGAGPYVWGSRLM